MEEKGVRRWLVDISKWNPSLDRFSLLVSLLPPHEHSTITRFVKFEDRKRAFVSRLLQYLLVNKVLDIPFDKIIIHRTAEGKPYLENCIQNSEYPNFNFNASHSGDYVGIACDPLCLVGLDIVSIIIPKQETALEYISNFSSYFTSLEWSKIINTGTLDEMLAEFYRYWCLKEAYVKSTGAGVGFGLDRLEFHHKDWTNITIFIDGKVSKEWRFWLFELDKKHLASIARELPSTAVESYRRNNEMKANIEEELCSEFWLPNPSFTLCTVEELILALNSDGCST